MLNRLHNCKNPYQGPSKKVLCLCSAGLLRSPTAAFVLSMEPFNFNTRSAGIRDYALIPVDPVLLHWADEIVVMEKWMVDEVFKFKEANGKVVICLDVPDNFSFRDAELMELIKSRYLDSD